MNKSPMYNETECIGKIECPWCGMKFDATDIDCESQLIDCPECKKTIEVISDMVYSAYPVDWEDSEVTE